MSNDCRGGSCWRTDRAIRSLSGTLALMALAAVPVLPADDASAQSAGYYAARQSYQASASRNPRAASRGGGLFGGLFGSGNTSRGFYARSSPAPGYGRYRTLCVRSCDGYYWPVSYATSRAGFSRDAEKCASSCAAPAKLYFYRNPGADVEQMVDLKGQPYARSEHAFRYRKEYVKDCRCTPEPWSEAAKQDYAARMAEPENPGPVQMSSAHQIQTPDRVSAPVKPRAPRPRISNRKRSKKARWRAAPEEADFSGKWWAGSW